MPTGAGWSITGYSGSGRNSKPIYQYDADAAAADRRDSFNTTEVQAAKDVNQDTRNMFIDLYNQVGTTVADLTNAGRQEEAAQLRDAAERFARSGSQTGVTSDQRIASLQKLAGTLRVQSQRGEAADEFAGISKSLEILKSIAGLDRSTLNDAYTEASASFSGSQSSRPQSSFSGGGTTSRRTQSPTISRTPVSARQTSSTTDNPYFAWKRQASLDASNRREAQNFQLQANAPQHTPFANWNTPTDNRPRQWGETFSGSPSSPQSLNPSAGAPLPNNPLSNKNMDLNSPTVAGGYTIDPITGKRTLIGTGKPASPTKSDPASNWISGIFDVTKGKTSYASPSYRYR